MEEYKILIIQGLIISAIYVVVFGLVLADLWSGARKAKIRGELRTSEGYRRTVNKLGKYYNLLFAFTLVDIMQMGGTWYFQHYYVWHFPMFPFITFLGAIGIGLIEIKSIYEKAGDKTKVDYQQVVSLVSQIIQNKGNPEDVAKCVNDYLTNDKEEEK